MSGYGSSPILVSDPFPDPRVEAAAPTLTELQQRQFVKMALSNVPEASSVFNQHFGGNYKASPFGFIPIPDTGVPWTLTFGR